jgi:hypothetical protein
VVVYHFLILLPPFVFWGWWQGKNPTDMQNAAVPTTVALGMLSLFWILNELLPHGRRLGAQSTVI